MLRRKLLLYAGWATVLSSAGCVIVLSRTPLEHRSLIGVVVNITLGLVAGMFLSMELKRWLAYRSKRQADANNAATELDPVRPMGWGKFMRLGLTEPGYMLFLGVFIVGLIFLALRAVHIFKTI